MSVEQSLVNRRSSTSNTQSTQNRMNQLYNNRFSFNGLALPYGMVEDSNLINTPYANIINKGANVNKNGKAVTSADLDKKSDHETSSTATRQTADQTAEEIAKGKNTNNNKNNSSSSSKSKSSSGSSGTNSYTTIVRGMYHDSTSSSHKDIYHSANIFSATETTKSIFNERYRYGVLNLYQNITTAREVLFFTKPDLAIFGSGDGYDKNNFNSVLAKDPFFIDLNNRYPEVLYALQSSCGSVYKEHNCPFNNLLGNMVQSNLDVPSTTAEMIETPANMYGVSYKYRGSSEGGDDNHTFSLEFKDTKYLPVYNFFKAYDLYEIYKHHGLITPKVEYIVNKVLHDQYSIYKFILDEDMETIIFYAKYYGVKSVNLPRDVFNSTTYDNGISYSVDFDAAFVEDSNPLILADFNDLAYSYFKSQPNDIPVYNVSKGAVDMRTAKCAIVVREKNGSSVSQIVGQDKSKDLSFNGRGKLLSHVPGGIVYKLKWKGDQSV